MGKLSKPLESLSFMKSKLTLKVKENDKKDVKDHATAQMLNECEASSTTLNQFIQQCIETIAQHETLDEEHAAHGECC